MRKNTMQKRKHTLAIYPGDQIAVVTMYPTGAMRAEGEWGLARLVWKYFAEEISQVLQETQQTSAAAKGLLTTGNSQKR
ncbi:MAG: hypothetical protein ACTHLX_25190 [Candidatus Binatia bacterium]